MYPSQTEAGNFTFSVIQFQLFWTLQRNSRIYYMSLAAENSIVVCGEPCGRTAPDSETIRSLVRYRLEDGQLMCNADLRAEMNPAGIASVTFNRQNCVALSYYRSVYLY